MKRLFRKIRSIYRKNPLAYLSLAVIAISLTVGTSISNLGLIPQILRIGGSSRNCARLTKASDCQSTPSCSWIPEGETTKCSFNTSGQCPEDCKYTPRETIECSSLNQIGCIDTEQCQWQQQTSKRVCSPKTVIKSCSFSDGNCRQNGCDRVSPQAAVYGCNCSTFSSSQLLCEANDCSWTVVKSAVSASCRGEYTGEVEDCRRQTVAAHCTGGTQEINKGKCEGVYYPNGKCVSSSTIPSPSPGSSCDLPCPEGGGKCIINDEGQPMCLDREGEPTVDGTPCDPLKRIIGNDGLPYYPECSLDDPHYSCLPWSHEYDSSKGGYCEWLGLPFLFRSYASECNPLTPGDQFSVPPKQCLPNFDCVLKSGTDGTYICVNSSDEPLPPFDWQSSECVPPIGYFAPPNVDMCKLGYDCILDPGTGNFYICVNPLDASQCSLNSDSNPCEENEVCVAVTNSTSDYALETYKCLTQTLGLRACELNGIPYDHGVPGVGYCVTSNGRTTGYWRKRVCSDGEWIDGQQTWDPQTCEQTIKCADFNLTSPDSWEGFQRLGCCPKIYKGSKEVNEFGQSYSSLAGTALHRKHCQQETSTSFWDSLKEIF